MGVPQGAGTVDGAGQGPCLGVVVVNYGSSELLRRNLIPLSRSGRIVVVVDNPTTDEERAAVTGLSRDQGWALVTPTENLGFGGGVNLGATEAMRLGADVLLVINPDASIAEGDLDLLVRRVVERPNALVAPVTRDSRGEVWFAGAGLDMRTGQTVGPERLDEPGIEPWISGACFCIAADFWKRVGGFDHAYFLYWEDIDLSRRVRESGGILQVEQSASAVHDEGGTHGSRPRPKTHAKSDLYYYYNVRNRMLFAARHLTPRARRRWLRSSPAAAWEILSRGGRRQFLYSRSGLWAALRGIVDGARLGSESASTASDTPATRGRPVRVLMTYIAPMPFHNPYVKMLDQALLETGEVELSHFTWRKALFGRYDVVHAHWPEDVLAATTPLKAAVKRWCLGLLLARWWLAGTPVVRTVHNLELPSGLRTSERLLLTTFDRVTTDRILISDTTPPPSSPYSIVLHGDYTRWYGDVENVAPVPGRIVYFGMVRRYKNVEALARAFAATRDAHPDWSLRIAGNPSSDELVQTLKGAVGDDDRVEMTLRYLEDSEIVDVALSGELVVLPYREMHNSGSLLAALSLKRPVLVPENAANRAVADEVGPGWVYMYDGELTSQDLEEAMAAVSGRAVAEGPDLRRRSWSEAGLRHVAAYREALQRRTRH